MEPVIMVLGQSASVAACMAIDKQKSIQDINAKELQQTLLSNPTADKRTANVLCDNGDSNLVKISGSWQVVTNKCYGATALTIQQPAPDANVQFLMNVAEKGKFRLYSYYNMNAAAAPETSISIQTKKGITNTSILHKEVAIEGQTSGMWVQIGEFNLIAGERVTVTIMANGTNGVISADAVQLIKVEGK